MKLLLAVFSVVLAAVIAYDPFELPRTDPTLIPPDQVSACTKKLKVVMHFECKRLPSTYCDRFPDPEMILDGLTGEEYMGEKCCIRRCSWRTLKSMCCFLNY